MCLPAVFVISARREFQMAFEQQKSCVVVFILSWNFWMHSEYQITRHALLLVIHKKKTWVPGKIDITSIFLPTDQFSTAHPTNHASYFLRAGLRFSWDEPFSVFRMNRRLAFSCPQARTNEMASACFMLFKDKLPFCVETFLRTNAWAWENAFMAWPGIQVHSCKRTELVPSFYKESCAQDLMKCQAADGIQIQRTNKLSRLQLSAQQK